YDPNETIIFTLASVTGNANLGIIKVHTITLTEPPLVVEFASSASSVNEGSARTVAYTITLPTGVTPTISVGGTATQDTDYTYTVTPTGITVTALADEIYDPNETVVFTLTSVTGNANLGTTKTHTLTLTEAAVVVEFTAANSSLPEGSGSTVAYTIPLPADIVPTISVGGTATQGTDYTYTLTETGITVTTTADQLYEPNETIIFTITGASGNAILGTITTHTTTLTEPPLTVEFATTSSLLAEGSGSTVTYNITLPTGVSPTVTAGGTATQGVDYTYSVTQTGITVTTTADGLYDPNETIVFTLTGVSGNAVLGSVVSHTITITEPPLVVGFAAATSSLGEGNGSTIPYNITLPSGVTPSITASGTATQGTDYTYTVTQTGISVTATADGLYDPNETIIFTITGLTGNAVPATTNTHTVTVTEPPIVVQFARSSSPIGEGNSGTVLYNITLPAGVNPTITIGGTATQGTDYSYIVSSTGITVTTVADGLYDPNETIIFTLTAVSGNAILGSIRTHTITITEPPLVVEFATAASSLAEGTAGTIPYNIVLPAGVTPVLTVGGTATNGSDFTYSITANGITVTPSADGIYDPNETIIFTLTGMLGNAVLGTIKTHTVTLTEPQLVVQFTAPTSSLAEGNSGSVPFNKTLPAAVTPTITFGGTATQGTDYTSTVTQSGINITVLADGQLDADETIVLTITGVTGNATTGTTNTHTVTLNDPPIEVNFATASSTVQEGNAGTINYNLTLPAGVTPTASFSGTATEGVDFTYTITQTGITITTVADGNYEPNETIIVTLTGVSGNAVLGSAVTHTMTINEPALVVQFASATSTVSEGNTFTIPFNFTLPEAVIPVITTAGTATMNTDYTYSVTASGIVVSAITDVTDDPNETAIFTITGVSGNAVLGATVANTMTITLAPVVVEFQAAASTVQEGSQTTVSYTAALPPGVTPIVSIGGTATQGSDYTYTIGQNGISIQITTDALYEPSETIVITITGVNGNATTGSLLTHTVTINDPPLSVGF
ncbi:MAG: beta strand repeat-containing protein, partial [Bacteroidota bacterium]